MERNLHLMADEIRDAVKQWRPHCKCHKIPAIAQMQRDAGAIGITSAKVSEAEAFADAGIDDILIANMVIGPAKVERIARLCRTAKPIATIDHYAQAEALSAACVAHQVTCRTIIEVDLGMNRVGVRPGSDVLELARGIQNLSGIELVGVMGYEGHLLTVDDQQQKQTEIAAAMRTLTSTAELLRESGFRCEIVSAGGTGSYQITSHEPGITEIQAGGGIFGDPFYLDQCNVSGLTPCIDLLCTVVSRPKLDRAVIDAGRKSLRDDVYPARVVETAEGRPLPDARLKALNAEHGILELDGAARDLRIGDKIVVRPGYTDLTTPLHDHLHGLRDQCVETSWPIAARGKLQ